MDRQSERELIRAATSGDRAAAAQLISHHQRSLYGFILRMCGRPETAEDIVQEAFVRVLTNLHKFDDRYRFSTWLFTIGRRLYLNHAQKMKPSYNSDAVGAAGGTAPEPVDVAARTDGRGVAHRALQRALNGLTDEQRESVVLFHQHGWSIAIIAGHMGIPEGTVKSHLHRGRRRLRELLLETESGSAGCLEALGAPPPEPQPHPHPVPATVPVPVPVPAGRTSVADPAGPGRVIQHPTSSARPRGGLA